MRRYQAIPLVISKSDFDKQDWWKDSPTPPDLESEISKFLPTLNSWSEKLKQWGFDDGDRVDIWWDDGAISDVYVRIDVRDIFY